MGMIPSVEQAEALVREYNHEPFHLHHAKVVSGVMGYFAAELEPEHVDLWKVVGMLHDLDFEQYPEEHCAKEQEILREKGVDEVVVRACVSHGWPTCTDLEPQSMMEKVLYAVDELTGLIGAVAIMRPSKSVSDLEVKSVKKKFKQPSFAAGCSREVISKGAEMLGWTLEELIEKTILAMRSLMDELSL